MSVEVVNKSLAPLRLILYRFAPCLSTDTPTIFSKSLDTLLVGLASISFRVTIETEAGTAFNFCSVLDAVTKDSISAS